MPYYTVTYSYHHRNECDEWKYNLEAKNRKEALTKAFHYGVWMEFGPEEMPPLEEFMPINNKNEHTIHHEEIGHVIMWNDPPERTGEKRNIGFGLGGSDGDINSTDKLENCWIEIKARRKTQKSLAQAIKGYDHLFEKLPIKVLAAFLHRLDRLDSLED
ncbi:hypothetical protein KAR91_05995 [Candidatus Pacearchaeota archaeon]|nr:hypothetical protein [Candidatus Pacearchaeota archaeon]